MGQGLFTVLIQCAVEVTGLPAAVFHPKVNSRFELGSGQTTGSRATLLAGSRHAGRRRQACGTT